MNTQNQIMSGREAIRCGSDCDLIIASEFIIGIRTQAKLIGCWIKREVTCLTARKRIGDISSRNTCRCDGRDIKWPEYLPLNQAELMRQGIWEFRQFISHTNGQITAICLAAKMTFDSQLQILPIKISINITIRADIGELA